MIEGRIKSLDNIDINILGNIIKDKLKPDRTLMGIFHKLLKAGYMKYPNSVGSQALLLLNIYLTYLDEFIYKLKENYARGSEPMRIYYVRYVDEWVIGVEGPFQLAKKIKEDILTFLRVKLKLEQEETKITHLGKEYAKFLGHYLGWPSLYKLSEVKTLVRSTLRRGASQFTGNPDFLLRKVSFGTLYLNSI